MGNERRLPGRRHGYSSGRPEELWLRDDHLLCVRSIMMVENYQRFYYRDIESVTIVPTARRLKLNLIMGAGLGLAAFLMLFDLPTEVFVFFAIIVAIPMAINTAFGRSCTTVLRTRVNRRQLDSLRRLRTARKAVALLSTRITEDWRGWEMEEGSREDAKTQMEERTAGEAKDFADGRGWEERDATPALPHTSAPAATASTAATARGPGDPAPQGAPAAPAVSATPADLYTPTHSTHPELRLFDKADEKAYDKDGSTLPSTHPHAHTVGEDAPPLPPPLPQTAAVALRWHRALALAMVLQAVAALAFVIYPRLFMTVTCALLAVVTVAVAVMALIRQRREGADAAVRKACWSLGVFQLVFVHILLAIGGGLWGASTQPGFIKASLAKYHDELLAENGALRAICIVFAAIALLLAAWLSSALRRSRRR